MPQELTEVTAEDNGYVVRVIKGKGEGDDDGCLYKSLS